MRSGESVENRALDATKGLASLSIIIDDFDSTPKTSNNRERTQDTTPTPRIYPNDNTIKKILEEAEHRKNEFWKLIEEYSEAVENIKRIEQLETNNKSRRERLIKGPTVD